MGSVRPPDSNARQSWRGSSPEARANRWAWYAASAIILLLVGLILAAVVYRLSGRGKAESLAAFLPAGQMPPGFDTDHSAEARAFRSACSQCHALPSPSLYDEGGWDEVRRRMVAHIAARGLALPAEQVELAIAYVVRHGRAARSDSHPDRVFP